MSQSRSILHLGSYRHTDTASKNVYQFTLSQRVFKNQIPTVVTSPRHLSLLRLFFVSFRPPFLHGLLAHFRGLSIFFPLNILFCY